MNPVRMNDDSEKVVNPKAMLMNEGRCHLTVGSHAS